MMITQQINIHLDRRFLETPTVEAIQGESIRAVEFLLHSGGKRWTIPEGTTVTIRHRIYHEGTYYSNTYDTLPDNSSAYRVDGSILTVFLPAEVLSVWGVGELQIGLFNGKDTTALFSVMLRVQQDYAFDGVTPDVHNDVSAQIYSAIHQWADRNCVEDNVTADDLDALRADTQRIITEELAKHGQISPEFANSVADCTDSSKLYVLPDGYIYAYMKNTANATIPNIYNSYPVQFNKRLNSSGVVKEHNGSLLIGPIDVNMVSPYRLRVSGVSLEANYSQMIAVNYFSSAGGFLGFNSAAVLNNGANGLTVQRNNGVYECDIYDTNYANAASIYIKLGIHADTTTVISAGDVNGLFVELEPKNTPATTSYGWTNTGHAFVPADYEGRIASLEHTVTQLQDNERSDISIPNYWQEALDSAITKVKALQADGGRDAVSFLWFSDMHYNPGNRYVEHLGTLCAAIMEACHIPLAISSGDTMSAGIVTTEDQLLNWLTGAMDILKPIDPARLLIAQGNHDDVYGSYTNGNTTSHYVNKAGSDRVWNALHRIQSMDLRRTYGGNGSYFYLDNIPQQVRFVCLNSHYYDGEGYSNGTTSAMTMGFGSEQLRWLRDTALQVDDGWHVVIVTHVPPTAQAINGKTYYLSQLTDGGEFRTVISEAATNIIGIFCGHCHADDIVSDDLPCPILTVTCAINTPYDGTAANRVLGTDAETALDIVTINKATRTIHLTRLGAGDDRSINY